jgi:hypothetical protein
VSERRCAIKRRENPALNLIRSSLSISLHPIFYPPNFDIISDLLNMRMPNLTDAIGGMSLSSPHRVLVVGCAYGGIAAIVNLLELNNGKARQPIYPGPDFKGTKSRRGIEVTVIDERDGYCASLIS